MKRTGCTLTFVAGLLAVPVVLFFYVLSIGPAAWLMDHGFLGDQVYASLYRPVFFVAEKWDPLASFLIYWIDLWAPFGANLPP